MVTQSEASGMDPDLFVEIEHAVRTDMTMEQRERIRIVASKVLHQHQRPPEYVRSNADLISYVTYTANIASDAASKAVNAIISGITDALKRGEDITIRDFGVFFVVDRPARPGQNPKTGEPIQIQASKAPKFKAGKKLKDAING